MALSFSEKRALQKVIATNLASLQAGNLSFQDKRKYQKEIQDAFAKLKEVLDISNSDTASRIDQAYELGKQAFADGKQGSPALDEKLMAMIPPGQEVGTGDTKEIMASWVRGWNEANIAAPIPNQKLADLIAGKYNNETPEGFLKVLKEIVEEINDIEPVKPPTIAYIEANQDKVNSIMESALGEVFGKLWDKTKGFPRDPIATSSSPQQANDAVRIKPQEGDYGPPKKISIDIDDDFYGPTAFRAVIRAIEEARAGDTIEIKVNSNGGDTQSAQAIYVALLKTPAKTKATIINAYSAGSIVAMACDEIEPTPFCTMMIHNASTYSGGKLGDLAGKAAFLNDYFGEWFQQLYAGFLTEEELKDIIKGQDFWLKEPQIRERLKNWKPIRQRLQENGTIKAA